MSREDGYRAELVYTSKELSKKEKVMLTIASGDTEVLDRICPIEIDVDYVAILEVYNPFVRPDAVTGEVRNNYTNMIITAKDGKKYSTSSQYLTETVKDIVEDMQGEEDWKLKVFKRQSKNNSGMFLTATIV